MKKIVLFLALNLFFSASAQASLSISSFQVLFDADSPKRSDVVRVTNNSNTKKTYRIKMINFKQDENGKYSEISNALPGNPFASPYIAFSPHETTLEPGQSQTIRLMRKPMAAAPNGEYISHLLIQETPGTPKAPQKIAANELKFDIRALYGISIPIIIDKGNLNSSASIIKSSLTATSGKPKADITVKRSGTRSFWGNLIVKENNKEIGRINGFKIFLTSDRRRMIIPLEKTPSSKVSITLQDARTDAVISQQNI